MTTLSNTILTLSAASNNITQHYKPGELGKAEKEGRSALRATRQILENARKVVEGMDQQLSWVKGRVEEVGEEVVVFWTVSGKKWMEWLEEIVNGFREDLKVKEWCLKDVEKLKADRERFYFCCACWMDMAVIDQRKLKFVVAAFQAEKDAWSNCSLKNGGYDEVMEKSDEALRGNGKRRHSAAIAALLK